MNVFISCLIYLYTRNDWR